MVKPILDDKVTDWVRHSLDAYSQIGVLVGSAISIWEPSCLPTALALRDSIIRALFRKNRLLADLEVELEHHLFTTSGETSLRLETVLEEIDSHIPGILPSFISVLASGEPNTIHHAIADWILSGTISILYTTNQDTLIERALELRGARRGSNFTVVTPDSQTIGLPSPLVKLHGTIDDPKTIRTTFTQVGQQLPFYVTERLENDLTQFPVSCHRVQWAGR